MEIKKYLKDMNLNFKTFSHPPVLTCDEAEKYNSEIKGIHSKNLFLKNKKSNRFFLIIIPSKVKLELKRFEILLNEKLRFANEDELKNILNLSTGAVSPFGLINDTNSKTEIIISKDVWNSDFISFHPNINTETLELSKQDFHKYIESLKNKLMII